MRSQIGPKWVQNGSKMAPWRLLGGPGALPGGFREALGRRGRFLSDLWVDFGQTLPLFRRNLDTNGVAMPRYGLILGDNEAYSLCGRTFSTYF